MAIKFTYRNSSFFRCHLWFWLNSISCKNTTFTFKVSSHTPQMFLNTWNQIMLSTYCYMCMPTCKHKPECITREKAACWVCIICCGKLNRTSSQTLRWQRSLMLNQIAMGFIKLWSLANWCATAISLQTDCFLFIKCIYLLESKLSMADITIGIVSSKLLFFPLVVLVVIKEGSLWLT